MGNMSYCRFRNTLSDLRDCAEALSDGLPRRDNEEEREAAKKLIALCRKIVEDAEADGLES